MFWTRRDPSGRRESGRLKGIEWGTVGGVELAIEEEAVVGEEDKGVIEGDAGDGENLLGVLIAVGFDSDEFVS